MTVMSVTVEDRRLSPLVVGQEDEDVVKMFLRASPVLADRWEGSE